MPHWLPSFLEILQVYFGSSFIAAGILVAAAALAVAFAVFAFSKSHLRKSVSMLSAMAISTSLWIFIISSLMLCAGLMSEYDNHSPTQAVIDIVRLAIIPTVVLGPVVFYFLRNRAIRQVYPYFSFTRKGESDLSGDSVQSRTFSIFSGLVRAAKLSGVSLSIVPGAANLPPSAALDWKGERVVAISSRSINTLDDDELKAVLAHELGHIVHRDSLRKTLATAYRSAFLFDPIAHFVEAAIYRDGELYADEYSARLTGKPAALASALIKIHEAMKTTIPKVSITKEASMLLEDHDSSLFSKQPSLTLRIKKLLEMEAEEEPENFEPTDRAIA